MFNAATITEPRVTAIQTLAAGRTIRLDGIALWVVENQDDVRIIGGHRSPLDRADGAPVSLVKVYA